MEVQMSILKFPKNSSGHRRIQPKLNANYEYSDQVERSDVIDAIGSWQDSGENLKPRAIENLIRRIRKLPHTVSFRANGYWTGLHDGTYQCSECGSFEYKESNFCPYCGSEMET